MTLLVNLWLIIFKELKELFFKQMIKPMCLKQQLQWNLYLFNIIQSNFVYPNFYHTWKNVSSAMWYEKGKYSISLPIWNLLSAQKQFDSLIAGGTFYDIKLLKWIICEYIKILQNTKTIHIYFCHYIIVLPRVKLLKNSIISRLVLIWCRKFG